MHSIRRTLLMSILSVVAVVTLLLAVATYFSIRHEMDELYDENMKQLAAIVAKTDLEARVVPGGEDFARVKLHGEEEFLIQVWSGGGLDYTSHLAIEFPPQGHDGFGDVSFRQHNWRFYRLRRGADVVQIAQDMHTRHGVIGEVYRVVMAPILIQLPLLAGLIWFFIGYGLQPLTRISNLIGKRNAAFLDPLPAGDVPVELSAVVAALNDLLDRLKQALDAQRRFTADAAHELRTPLAAIRLQLDILHRAAGPTEKAAALESLEQGVARCIRLAQQLLALARQAPDAAALAFTAVPLDRLAAEIIQSLRPFSQAKGINLTYDTGVVPGTVVRGNPSQLAVMIENLVHNAILYTPENGNVRMALRQDRGLFQLDIADDGIGISGPDRARVFDRFFRVAGTGVTGSGLGLAIVKAIADLHGIEITILEGLNGKGTTFRLIIPIDRSGVS